MTLTEQIEAALKLPVDKELMAAAEALTLELTKVQATHRQSPCADLIYSFLVRIRDLEKQVEQERWRDAEKEKPESACLLVLSGGLVMIGAYSAKDECFVTIGVGKRVIPTHWKPINLPSVLTKSDSEIT